MGEGSTVLETLPDATAIGQLFAQFWSGGQEMILHLTSHLDRPWPRRWLAGNAQSTLSAGNCAKAVCYEAIILGLMNLRILWGNIRSKNKGLVLTRERRK